MEQKIRVVVVDDVPEALDAIAFFITNHPNMELVGEGKNGQEAIEIARAVQPDVILMDLQMPVLDGVQATEIILAELPNTYIIAVTTYYSDDYVVAALQAGVHGYLLKDSTPQEIYDAIEAAAHHRSIIDARALSNLIASLPKPVPQTEKLWESFNPTQQKIIKLLCAGYSNREIAKAMNIAESTVKNNVVNIMKTLGVKNRLQVSIEANRFRFPL